MNSKVSYQISRKATHRDAANSADVGFTQEVMYLYREQVALIVGALRDYGGAEAWRLGDEIERRILQAPASSCFSPSSEAAQNASGGAK